MTQVPQQAPTTGHSRIGRVFSITAFVFAALSLVAIPILFGLIALILAVVAMVSGDRRGGVRAVIAAVVCTTIGLLLVHYEVFPRLFPGTFG
jgi:hypothetical protein